LLAVARRYLDEGNFGLAVLKLNEAVSLEPASAPAYNARGYAFLRTRNYASALADFSKAIELRPSYANAYWNRGVARRLLGDKQGSVDDAQKAIRYGWVVDSSALKLKASR
jgi:Flp pilus assembly protein TadD